MNKTDYYEILEIEREAAPQKIKEAYRRLAFQYHPDRNGGNPDVLERMKAINEAYAVLSDPQKRTRYDSLRHSYGNSAHDRFREGFSDEDIFKGSDIGQVFEEISRSFGFRSFEDVFKEIYGSGHRSFHFQNGNFFGRGFVWFGGANAPQTTARQKGVFPWLMQKLAGYAFKKITHAAGRHSNDRYDQLMLSTVQARRGGKIPYTDKLSSRNILITVPPGVAEGQMIRLQGLGNVNGYDGSKGDLYLKVEITRSVLHKIREFLKSA